MSVLSQRETPISDRTALIHAAFWIESLTITWMVIEGAVAIGAAIAANSLTLLAFGIDSLIELASRLCWSGALQSSYGMGRFSPTSKRFARRVSHASIAARISSIGGYGDLETSYTTHTRLLLFTRTTRSHSHRARSVLSIQRPLSPYVPPSRVSKVSTLNLINSNPSRPASHTQSYLV